MNKKFFSLLALLCVCCLNIMGQNATKILDKTASKFKSAGGVKITYTYSNGNERGTGTLKVQGQKFVNSFGDMVVWFNGKTMWTLVKSNEEVNVTNPSAKELAKMNPYSFVNLYKKGYKAELGKSTADYHEVLLTATNAHNSLQNLKVRVSKSAYQPQYVKMTGNGYQAEITVKSYATNQKFSNSTFAFNSAAYPDVDVIDLR